MLHADRRVLPRLRRSLLALVLAAGCSAAAGGSGGPPSVAVRTLHLDSQDPARETVGRLRFLGAVAVSGGGIGGLSGFVLREDGERFTAVSDRGKLVFGRLAHDGSGRLTGVSGVTHRPLPHPGGSADAEELLRLPDGGWLVAFEREHRILRYPPGFDRGEGAVTALPAPPGLEDAPRNGGLEAMALLPDGRLLVLEEGADDGVPERRGWVAGAPLRARNDWAPLTYRAAPGFRPTGAAVTPDGDVLVLERFVSMIGGWQARLVRLPGTAPAPGAVLGGEELGRLALPLLVDNFEAVAAVPGADGTTLVYLVSDDNFSPLQHTIIAQFALDRQGQ